MRNRSGACACEMMYSKPEVKPLSSLRDEHYACDSLMTEFSSLFLLRMAIVWKFYPPLCPQAPVIGAEIKEGGKGEIVHPAIRG